MAVSKAQQKATNKWISKAYDRVNLTLPKGQKEVVHGHAAARGESVNGFIGRAISETMERDSGGMPLETAGKGIGSTQAAETVSIPSETIKAAQAGTEAGKRPALADKAKAAEELFGILGDLGAVDLDKARCERLGIVYLSPDILEAAQQAAEDAGEAVPDFIRRAVEAQAQRDQASRSLGINPATGGKLEKEA